MSMKLPQHMRDRYGTLRRFRANKRQQVREALRILSDLRVGCAHTPAYKEIVDAANLIETARLKLSVEKWGK